MSLERLLDATRIYVNKRNEKLVRAAIAEINWDMPVRHLPPLTVGGSRHLTDALNVSSDTERELIVSLIDNRSELHWGRSYTAEDFGSHFYENYGYVELVGQRGHFVSTDLAMGFVIFGPQVQYPNHWHDAEELYFPLTGGSLWSRDDGEFTARDSGEFVFHTSNMKHAMTTEKHTLLALYLWRSPADISADLKQKSHF